MYDFRVRQLKKYLGKDNISLIDLYSNGNYWIKQQEFCDELRNTPLTDIVVIHVQDPALSLSHALVVPEIEKIIAETGRNKDAIYIDSSNTVESDTSWENLFHRKFLVSPEFTRSLTYWSDSPLLSNKFKTWAAFVEHRTTPELLSLYSIWQNQSLKQHCFLKVASNTGSTEMFDQADKIHDTLDEWLPIENKMQRLVQHNNLREFARNCPIDKIDNFEPKSLIALGSEYLFEIVFETVTRGFTFSPTTKTVRTIVAEKPMIVYAPANFLKKLQNIGFKTFENLWDESYDQLEGLPRYTAMMKLIEDVANMKPDQQFKLYQQSREICTYNREVLSNLRTVKYFGKRESSTFVVLDQ